MNLVIFFSYVLEENTLPALIVVCFYRQTSQYLMEHEKILAQTRTPMSEARARNGSVQHI